MVDSQHGARRLAFKKHMDRAHLADGAGRGLRKVVGERGNIVIGSERPDRLRNHPLPGERPLERSLMRRSLTARRCRAQSEAGRGNQGGSGARRL
jgi:hypothetical protein